MDTGQRLRAARVAAGMGLGRLAEAIGRDRGHLSRVERGEREATPALISDYSRALDVDAAELMPAESFDTDRIAYVARHPQRVDEAAVRTLSSSLHGWRKLDDSLGAEAVSGPVAATTRLVEALVREAQGPIRPAVLDMGAQWLQFAGWLATATNRHDDALNLQDRMLEWAIELGDPDLTSTALSVKGHRAWALDAFGPMVGLSEAARRDRTASPAVLAVAAQQQARGHALLGDAEETERLLEEADEEAVRGVEAPDRIPAWLYFHSTDLLILQRGLAYKYLADAGVGGYRRRAIESLTAGLDGLDPATRESDWIGWYAEQLTEAAAG